MTRGVLDPRLIVPLGLLLLLLLAIAQARNARSDAPRSRRRIRAANGWVMAAAIPVLCVGFAFINPTLAPGAFLLTWGAGVGLMLLAVLLACFDVMNTMRLNRRTRDEVRDAYRSLADQEGRARGSAPHREGESQ